LWLPIRQHVLVQLPLLHRPSVHDNHGTHKAGLPGVHCGDCQLSIRRNAQSLHATAERLSEVVCEVDMSLSSQTSNDRGASVVGLVCYIVLGRDPWYALRCGYVVI